MKRKVFARCAAYAAAMMLLLCMALAGCGRKAAPAPDYSKDMFAFSELSATLTPDGVVSLSGKLTGKAENLEYLVLEMQPVEGELCEGCPFLATEQFRVESITAVSASDATAFSVVYRPLMPAEMYRWRILGYNVHSGIGAAVSDMQVLGRDAASEVPVGPVPVPGE